MSAIELLGIPSRPQIRLQIKRLEQATMARGEFTETEPARDVSTARLSLLHDFQSPAPRAPKGTRTRLTGCMMRAHGGSTEICSKSERPQASLPMRIRSEIASIGRRLAAPMIEMHPGSRSEAAMVPQFRAICRDCGVAGQSRLQVGQEGDSCAIATFQGAACLPLPILAPAVAGHVRPQVTW